MNTIRALLKIPFPDRTCGFISLLLTATLLIAATRLAGLLQVDTTTAVAVYAACALTGTAAAALKILLISRNTP